jgi:hypothetical protein
MLYAGEPKRVARRISLIPKRQPTPKGPSLPLLEYMSPIEGWKLPVPTGASIGIESWRSPLPPTPGSDARSWSPGIAAEGFAPTARSIESELARTTRATRLSMRHLVSAPARFVSPRADRVKNKINFLRVECFS